MSLSNAPDSSIEYIAEYFVLHDNLDISALESILSTKKGGRILDDVERDVILPMEDYYMDFVPHYVSRTKDRDFDYVKKTLDKFPDINTPNSMLINSDLELFEHALFAYQVSNFHYILAKGHNMKSDFPKLCCSISSVNLSLSLLEHGYSNATYVYNAYADHAYSVLPFVYPKRNLTGVILIDPTNDQADKNNSKNLVLLKFGDEWSYKNNWSMNAELFPERASSIDVRRKLTHDFDGTKYHKDVIKFLKQAYANPVMVNIAKEKNLFLNSK